MQLNKGGNNYCKHAVPYITVILLRRKENPFLSGLGFLLLPKVIYSNFSVSIILLLSPVEAEHTLFQQLRRRKGCGVLAINILLYKETKITEGQMNSRKQNVMMFSTPQRMLILSHLCQLVFCLAFTLSSLVIKPFVHLEFTY